MVRIWDFLMRRKPLLLGFLLIFSVSAAFSSVYLRPNTTREPVNVPDEASATEETTLSPEPEPEVDSTTTPSPVADSTIHLAIVAPSPEEVTALGETVIIPRTNFGFTLPGNIINLAPLNHIAASHQLEQVDAVKTWHYIVSATTAALIFGGIMVCLARFLSKNMLQ